MSVQRIVIPSRHTKGWQARVYTAWPRYVSRFFSDKVHGGSRKAKAAAEAAHAHLELLARKHRKARA